MYRALAQELEDAGGFNSGLGVRNFILGNLWGFNALLVRVRQDQLVVAEVEKILWLLKAFSPVVV